MNSWWICEQCNGTGCERCVDGIAFDPVGIAWWRGLTPDQRAAALAAAATVNPAAAWAYRKLS